MDLLELISVLRQPNILQESSATYRGIKIDYGIADRPYLNLDLSVAGISRESFAEIDIRLPFAEDNGHVHNFADNLFDRMIRSYGPHDFVRRRILSGEDKQNESSKFIKIKRTIYESHFNPVFVEEGANVSSTGGLEYARDSIDTYLEHKEKFNEVLSEFQKEFPVDSADYYERFDEFILRMNLPNFHLTIPGIRRHDFHEHPFYNFEFSSLTPIFGGHTQYPQWVIMQMLARLHFFGNKFETEEEHVNRWVNMADYQEYFYCPASEERKEEVRKRETESYRKYFGMINAKKDSIKEVYTENMRSLIDVDVEFVSSRNQKGQPVRTPVFSLETINRKFGLLYS